MRQKINDDNEEYYIRDYLGNIKAIFDKDGNMTDYRRYRAYGEEEKAPSNGFGFTSREYDEITGLYYYRSRYYDPTIGRFIQKDNYNEAGLLSDNPEVIYNPSQLNNYAYVANNPVNYIDPWGEATLHVWSNNVNHFKHASLELEDGTYISFWPGNSNKTIFNKIESYTDYNINFPKIWGIGAWSDKNFDLQSYDVHKEINFYFLNEKKVKNWFDIQKENKRYYKYPFIQCASTVHSAIMTGSEKLPMFYWEHIFVDPNDVLDEVNYLKKWHGDCD